MTGLQSPRMKINPSEYRVIEGADAEVRSWYAPTASGRIVYAYSRPHAHVDDKGKVTHVTREAGRCAVERDGVTTHFTNGFEIWLVWR